MINAMATAAPTTVTMPVAISADGSQAYRLPRAHGRPGSTEHAPTDGHLHQAVTEFGDDERESDAHDEGDGLAPLHVDTGARHHEYRPVPQVDAVGASADVAKNSRAERRPQERSRVSHRGDQRCGEEGEGEKNPRDTTTA